MSFLHLKTVYYLYLYLSLTSQFYCLTITFSLLCLCKQLIIYVSYTSRPGQTKTFRKWVMECWSHAPSGGPHQTLFGKTFIQQSVGRDKNIFWIPLWIFQIKKVQQCKTWSSSVSNHSVNYIVALYIRHQHGRHLGTEKHIHINMSLCMSMQKSINKDENQS